MLAGGHGGFDVLVVGRWQMLRRRLWVRGGWPGRSLAGSISLTWVGAGAVWARCPRSASVRWDRRPRWASVHWSRRRDCGPLAAGHPVASVGRRAGIRPNNSRLRGRPRVCSRGCRNAAPAGPAPGALAHGFDRHRVLVPRALPIMARVASCTTEVALTTCGSTSVGSPTLVAWATSGCFWKFRITLKPCCSPGGCLLPPCSVPALPWSALGTG